MISRKQATPDHHIHELLANRFSPYAFADRAVSEGDLLSLFEAARWAASSYNEQPWSYLVATKANSSSRVRSSPSSVARSFVASPPAATAFRQAISASRLSTSKRMRISWMRS